MALNFTGRLPSPEPRETPAGPSRMIIAVLVLAAAAFLVALIVFASTRLGAQTPKPRPEPALVGVAMAPAQTPVPVEAKPLAVAAPAPAPPAAKSETAAPTARRKFVAALRRAPGQITLTVEDDPQAQAYGQELQAIFREAGWTVSWSQTFGSGSATRGLAVALGSSPQDAAVAEAFAAAGIRIAGKAPSGSIVVTPEIFVGPPLEPRPAPPQPPSGPSARSLSTPGPAR